MKKDWLAAIFAFPSAILEGIEAFLKKIKIDEREVLSGSEYDPESDYQE